MHVLCDGNGALDKVVGADARREEEGAADAKDFVSELVDCRLRCNDAVCENQIATTPFAKTKSRRRRLPKRTRDDAVCQNEIATMPFAKTN